MHTGYVLTDCGEYYVQLPDPDSRFGFCLATDGQTWDGGLGLPPFTAVSLDSVPEEVREELDWLLDEEG